MKITIEIPKVHSNSNSNFTLVFEPEETINPNELAEFLYLFRALYCAAHELI